MGETKKIVVESFPVERLPDELRRGIENGQIVRVTIEAEDTTRVLPHTGRRTLRSFVGSAPGLYPNPGEATQFIRSLRDESDR